MPQLPSAVLLACLVALPYWASAAGYYVSPAGDDAHTGLGPDPAQALRTLQAGVDRLQPGDTLFVREGVYRETVTFPRSGGPEAPITVRPYESESVVVSGCDPVEGFARHEGDVWQAPMPWTLGPGRNQVFDPSGVLIEARFPNEPGPDLGMYVSDLSPLWPTFGEFSIPKETVKEQPGRIVSQLLDGQPDDYWKGACYYGIHYEGWAAQTGVVESSKSGEIVVTDRTGVWWFGSAYGGGYSPEEGRGMLVGHMNALDSPGEWHWQEGVLYLIPRDGQAPTGIEAKARHLAFDLSGREHIRIRGIEVKAASMRLADAAHCVVDDCHLSYISHYTRHYSIGQIEHGRDTIKSGETGIYVSGHDNSFLNCSVRISAGAGFYLRGYHHTIHNCLIDEVSYTSHYLNAITDAVSDFSDYEHFLVGGHVIAFNTMRNAGRHFFNFHGNGTSTQSRDRGPMDYMATLFAHNHLYNGMLQTRDAGLITGYYCSGGTLNGLNSQVVYNVLHDSYDLAAMRWGVLGLVYLDAGTCDVDLHHNLLWAAPGSLQRGLWYNTMCVDIREHANVFHPLFERTCAELTPEDFPEGTPFRFGHDFDSPPPLPVWPQLVEESIAAQDFVEASQEVIRSGDALTGLRDGQWCLVGEVDLDEGRETAVLSFASDLGQMNSDRSGRTAPRHQKVTDPLVMEVGHNDGLQEQIRRQWTFMYNVTDGAWIRFNQVPLGEGYRRLRIVYGNESEGPRWAEVRLDAPDGPMVGRVELPRTDEPRGGRIQIYAEAVGEVSPEATGTHDVFLVFHSEDGLPVGEFEYFRFEQYRGEIALQPNEVRLELRLGDPQGEMIGRFCPRATGGADTFKDMVAKLEPAAGTHRLYLVVRSESTEPIGAIAGLTLQRAAEPIDRTGVGVPPLWRDGKMVLPEPTNRPCARPADKYPARGAAGASGPRPICAARRTEAPPDIDGVLQEWPNEPAPGRITLRESYDGSPSAGPPSTAWLAYDEEALYVAASHPVKDPKALSYAGHAWGATDAMEIAIQDGLSEIEGPILNLYGWPDGHLVSTDQAGAPADAVRRLGEAVAYKAGIAGEGWQCEWRIPFSALGFSPASAPVVRLNIGVRKLQDEAWVIWRGTGGATYVVANAGLLAFPAELTASEPVARDGLEVWLDASAEGAVDADAEGFVSLWKDQSGAGGDAAQAEVQLRPLFVADGLNGKPALRFDEKRRTRLELPDLSSEKLTATVLAVFSNPVAGDEVNHDPRIFTASDGEGYDYQIGIALTVPGMQTGGPRQSLATFADRWGKRVRVGCFSPNYQTYFTGDISEILVYSRALEATETDRLRAYLAAKWGLE